MSRGGEYDDGPTVASDTAIESDENKIAGAPKGDSDSDVDTSTPFLTIPSLSKASRLRRRPLSALDKEHTPRDSRPRSLTSI